jgi:magnesium chelatase subunit D
VGDGSASVGDGSASVGDGSASVGDGSASVGDGSASVGDGSASGVVVISSGIGAAVSSGMAGGCAPHAPSASTNTSSSMVQGPCFIGITS